MVDHRYCHHRCDQVRACRSWPDWSRRKGNAPKTEAKVDPLIMKRGTLTMVAKHSSSDSGDDCDSSGARPKRYTVVHARKGGKIYDGQERFAVFCLKCGAVRKLNNASAIGQASDLNRPPHRDCLPLMSAPTSPRVAYDEYSAAERFTYILFHFINNCGSVGRSLVA